MRISLLIRYITNTDINSKYINNVAISQQLVSSGRVSAAISKESSVFRLFFLVRRSNQIIHSITFKCINASLYDNSTSAHSAAGSGALAQRLRMDGALCCYHKK